jgi:hypothetical protein
VQGERRDRVPDDIKGCWIGFPQCDLRKAPTFCLHYAAPNRELWRLWDSLLWDGMQRQDPRGCCGIGGHRPVPLVWAGTAFAAGFHGALAPVVAFVGRCERHPRGPRSGVSVGELPSSGVVVSTERGTLLLDLSGGVQRRLRSFRVAGNRGAPGVWLQRGKQYFRLDAGMRQPTPSPERSRGQTCMPKAGNLTFDCRMMPRSTAAWQEGGGTHTRPAIAPRRSGQANVKCLPRSGFQAARRASSLVKPDWLELPNPSLSDGRPRTRRW